MEATTRASADEVTSPAENLHGTFRKLQDHLDQRIIGQHALTERLLIALLADGHLLVEGAPGLAKTKAIKELAQAIEGDDHRIQFTPDLLPADVTGTDIYRSETGTFEFQSGPIFHNLILADEINRAPAKVQSALLEAMAEHQVTIGLTSYPLPELFLVMATQNPIEQEGTYSLPEAQLDRFLMHVRVHYPDSSSERRILSLVRDEAMKVPTEHGPRVSQQAIFAARDAALAVHMSEALEEYLVQLILATREPGRYDETLSPLVEWGSSPRGTIALDRCSRVRAWLQNRDYVTPEDVHAIAKDVLRHRILMSFEAESQGITSDDFLDKVMRIVPLP